MSCDMDSEFIRIYSPLQLLRPRLRLRPKPALRAPAINLKHSTRHMRRAQTAQKQNQSRKILRFPDPPARLSCDESIHRLLEPERRHPRREDAWTDAVHCDVMWHEFRGLEFGEMDTCGFAGAVGESPGAWGGETAFGAGGYVDGLDAGHGGDVDYAAGVVGRGAFDEKGLESDRCWRTLVQIGTGAAQKGWGGDTYCRTLL